jgi:hypothetical protein
MLRCFPDRHKAAHLGINLAPPATYLPCYLLSMKHRWLSCFVHLPFLSILHHATACATATSHLPPLINSTRTSTPSPLPRAPQFLQRSSSPLRTQPPAGGTHTTPEDRCGVRFSAAAGRTQVDHYHPNSLILLRTRTAVSCVTNRCRLRPAMHCGAVASTAAYEPGAQQR